MDDETTELDFKTAQQECSAATADNADLSPSGPSSSSLQYPRIALELFTTIVAVVLHAYKP